MVNGTAFLGGFALARFGLTAFGAGFGLRGVEWKAMVSTSSDGLSGFSSVSESEFVQIGHDGLLSYPASACVLHDA